MRTLTNRFFKCVHWQIRFNDAINTPGERVKYSFLRRCQAGGQPFSEGVCGKSLGTSAVDRWGLAWIFYKGGGVSFCLTADVYTRLLLYLTQLYAWLQVTSSNIRDWNLFSLIGVTQVWRAGAKFTRQYFKTIATYFLASTFTTLSNNYCSADRCIFLFLHSYRIGKQRKRDTPYQRTEHLNKQKTNKQVNKYWTLWIPDEI